MATEIKKQDKKVINAIQEDLEQLSSYDGAVASRFIKHYETNYWKIGNEKKDIF